MKFLASKGLKASLSESGKLVLSPPELVKAEILAYVRANATRLKMELVASETVHRSVDVANVKPALHEGPPVGQEEAKEDGYFNIGDEALNTGVTRRSSVRGGDLGFGQLGPVFPKHDWGQLWP
jgi:hypothetical protein